MWNESLANVLGLNAEWWRSEQGVACLAGNQVPQSVSPIAQAYACHQFGHFTMLGDGREILIGEHLTHLVSGSTSSGKVQAARRIRAAATVAPR